MPFREVQRDSMERIRARTTTEAPPARDPEVDSAVVGAAAGAEVGVVVDADSVHRLWKETYRMKSQFQNRKQLRSALFLSVIYVTCLYAPVFCTAQQPSARNKSSTAAALRPKKFETPREAAAALITAAEKYDVFALDEIFGARGKAILVSGELGQDRQAAADFVSEAKERNSV